MPIILVVAVGKEPQVAVIEDALEVQQAIVGGYIESIRAAQDVSIICNEEGLVYDLPRNRKWNGVYLRGAFFVMRHGRGELTDLTPEDITHYKQVFANVHPPTED